MSSTHTTSSTLSTRGITPNMSPAKSPSSSQSNEQELHALKRRLCALEAENAQMYSKIRNKPIETLSTAGRAIRRLVTLVEPISDMIAEHDRRQLCMDEDGTTVATVQSQPTPEQERTHSNFQNLIRWCPLAAKLIDAGQFDLHACREVQAGADAARGDDASTLKGNVIQWIMTNAERIDPPLASRNKEYRGFHHFSTGRLICPVDYDWADPIVRASIREIHPDFRVTAYSWPLFLYKDCVYDSEEPSKGLFQGDLLVKAFKCIFTSPSSVRVHDAADKVARFKGPRPRRHVAELLRMRTVQPRAIAYIAVQVRFALSSAPSWAVLDEDFNYEEFYYNIVDYFESPGSVDKAAEMGTLLLWWNRIVFGRRNVSDYRPLEPEKLSVARSRK